MGGSGGAGAPPVRFKYGRTGDYHLRGIIISEIPLQIFDKLLQFECKVSALVHFAFYFICSTDVAVELKQLFFRADVKGKLNFLPKSFALPLCFLKPYWQLLAIFA